MRRLKFDPVNTIVITTIISLCVDEYSDLPIRVEFFWFDFKTSPEWFLIPFVHYFNIKLVSEDR